MYKVLIADDERIIRDGVSSMIEWGAQGLSLEGTAENGLAAYDMIVEYRPDIVITDIKMPGMDGLTLIAKVHQVFPETIFIVLSGYGEFEYANQAMKYGVKYYILKPCDEDEIVVALEKAIMELKIRENRENVVKEMNASLQKVLPQVKEQFMQDFIKTRKYNTNDCDYFKHFFGIQGERFKLLILRGGEKCELLERFALKNISEEVLGKDLVCLSTILEDFVVLLIQSAALSDLMLKLEKIKNVFSDYYHLELSVSVSGENTFPAIPAMYDEAQECLRYAFYLGEGSIITKNDVVMDEGDHHDLQYDYDKTSMSIKTGNIESLKEQLNDFFERMAAVKQDIELARTYCMELFLTVIRHYPADQIQAQFKGIMLIQDMLTLHQIQSFIEPIALAITQENYENTTRRYSRVVDSVVRCIREQIQNPELSLKWMAREILYMNEDYLGRMFQKETKMKFSHYVLNVRMEKAKQLIESDEEYRMIEISEMTGFGENNHYFSQVFKKFTGYTPSEYKAFHNSRNQRLR